MNRYTYTVCLTVEVEAFDEGDAEDILHDNFDPGSDCGVEIKAVDIKQSER